MCNLQSVLGHIRQYALLPTLSAVNTKTEVAAKPSYRTEKMNSNSRLIVFVLSSPMILKKSEMRVMHLHLQLEVFSLSFHCLVPSFTCPLMSINSSRSR